MAYQQYPPQGAYPPPGMAPKPSGATGITAGILAILGGLWVLSGFVIHVIMLFDGRFASYYVLGAVADLVAGGLLLFGGIFLVMRKRAGRMLTVAGSGAAIFFALVTVVLKMAGLPFYFSFGGIAVLRGFLGLIVLVLIPAIATIVLASLPTTAKWLGAKQAVAMPPQNFGYPQGPPPGYPPPGPTIRLPAGARSTTAGAATWAVVRSIPADGIGGYWSYPGHHGRRLLSAGLRDARDPRRADS